jgi:hypothetical protein
VESKQVMEKEHILKKNENQNKNGKIIKKSTTKDSEKHH